MVNLNMSWGWKQYLIIIPCMLLGFYPLAKMTLFRGDISKDLVISEVQKRTDERNLEIVGPHTYSDQNITIRWSDGSTESYGSDRVLDLDGRRKLSALGKFNRRHFEFAVTSAEPVWLEAVEFNIDGGFH